MAKVIYVSQIQLGDNANAMSWVYEDILTETNPDIILLATSTSVPKELRHNVYDHLRTHGKPVLIADLNIPLPPSDLRIEEGDRYIDTYKQRAELYRVIPETINQLLSK